MKKMILWLCLVCSLPLFAQSSSTPKREFRGAWIQCVNGQFQGLSPDKMRSTLSWQLDKLRACGINAIMFQVRAEADALYPSKYEPWSRFLSGTQGVAPTPLWDPLDWMIKECHARGMELHAWINPYRAKTKGTNLLAATHPYNLHPDRFFAYEDLLVFDPARPENRASICTIVKDILTRYDVDGLHMDDYFYPYPTPGVPIPDDASFVQYQNGFTDRGDWRRYNVNLLIEQLFTTIRSIKPWVKFGVAPFGIYHNAKDGNQVPGSNTNGLQNYDQLYADVLYWINKGWVDYNIPQIYWEIGHKAADYDTLIRWWSKNASNRPLFIGQDVERTVKAADLKNPNQNQMQEKYRLQRLLPSIEGSCQWYAAAVANNVGGYADALQLKYHRAPALQPLMPFIDDKAPRKVKGVKAVWTADGYMLVWREPKAKTEMDKVYNYVVYCFRKGEKVNLNSPEHIVTITPRTYFKLPYMDGKQRFTYVVTALDRLQNESKAKKAKAKL